MLDKFEKMYVEAIDKETADKIVHVLCIAAKCTALQYYFLADHVCNALGIKHYYNLTNPFIILLAWRACFPTAGR